MPYSFTPHKQKVYDFIVAFKQDHDGVSPSVLEIGGACGITSTSTTRFVLNGLERLGLIECEYAGKSRMIKVVGGRWIPPTKKPTPQDRAVHAASLSLVKE